MFFWRVYSDFSYTPHRLNNCVLYDVGDEIKNQQRQTGNLFAFVLLIQ